MIVGISGLTYADNTKDTGSAGAGKDAVASILMEHFAAHRLSFADPMKRFCREVFDFSHAQVFGDTSQKNEPDARWTRQGKDIKLTPRYAMQTLGTEWGRNCADDVWVRLALRTASRLLKKKKLTYTRELGIEETPYEQGRVMVAIPDVRFKNEYDGLREAGAKLVRVKRKVDMVPSQEHISENDLSQMPDSRFDYVIENDGSLAELHSKVAQMMDVLSGRIRPYKDEEADIPPFQRS